MNKNILIIIPPLGVNSHKIGEKITKDWADNFGIDTINWPIFWENSKEKYEDRLKRLIDKIDELIAEGKSISLLGLSAGGSVVVNAFVQRKDKVSAVINVGGRLKKGKIDFPQSKQDNDNNFLFQESVVRCEKNIESLTSIDKDKFLTVRPLWDEFSPVELSMIDGAKNIKNLSFGHIIGIILAMTVYRNKIIDFIKSR
jgi:hypothetical protein